MYKAALLSIEWVLLRASGRIICYLLAQQILVVNAKICQQSNGNNYVTFNI